MLMHSIRWLVLCFKKNCVSVVCDILFVFYDDFTVNFKQNLVTDVGVTEKSNFETNRPSIFFILVNSWLFVVDRNCEPIRGLQKII